MADHIQNSLAIISYAYSANEDFLFINIPKSIHTSCHFDIDECYFNAMESIEASELSCYFVDLPGYVHPLCQDSCRPLC